MIDLFSTPDALPSEVLSILGKFEKSENDYTDCENLVTELNAVGYTCEFGLDAVPFNLQCIEDFQILASDFTEEEKQEFLKNESKFYNDLQSSNLEKCVKEVKSSFQFHEITEVHAKAIFNNNGKVYGFTPEGMKLLQRLDEFDQFDAYYID